MGVGKERKKERKKKKKKQEKNKTDIFRDDFLDFEKG